MGSGSTGVSAKLTGRSFYGIEKEEEYYKIAQERIGSVEPEVVCTEDSQLTTQIHKEMKTVPTVKYESKKK
jgi:DNA modification methylase